MASQVGTKIKMAHSAQFCKDYFGAEFAPAKTLSPGTLTAWKITGATDSIELGVTVPTYVVASYWGATVGIGKEKHFTFICDRSAKSHMVITYKLSQIKGVTVHYKTA